MIGKAIYKILTENLPAHLTIKNGGVYPLYFIQDSYTVTGSGGYPFSTYPQIVYHTFTDPILSKDTLPNMNYVRLTMQVVSHKYIDINTVSSQLRDVLDHYVDRSSAGLAGVPGYRENGNYHNLVSNVDIQHIFYQEEEDEYFDKIKLFTRRIEYDVYYYDDIIKYGYDKAGVWFEQDRTVSNPLALCYDFTQVGLMRKKDYTNNIPDYAGKVINGGDVFYTFNKLGKTDYQKINTFNTGSTNEILKEYLETDHASNMPVYYDGVADNCKPYLFFQNNSNLGIVSQSQINNYPNQLFTPYGFMIVMVYKPVNSWSENYLMGSNSESQPTPFLVSHSKLTDGIKIKCRYHGLSFSGSPAEFTIVDGGTDSTNYWGGDYHFLCLSLGGSKAYTGGSRSYKGWFEYFNSNYNPRLTTGQISYNNKILGDLSVETDAAPNNEYYTRIGSVDQTSAGFRMYEMLLFTPPEKIKRGSNVDDPPFQPTDILYKNIKDYIYRKYESLK
tara:strand:- start:16854 stop:18353 length:1500 start_codon:yes stop_codon:yes gene_type:complete